MWWWWWGKSFGKLAFEEEMELTRERLSSPGWEGRRKYRDFEKDTEGVWTWCNHREDTLAGPGATMQLGLEEMPYMPIGDEW